MDTNKLREILIAHGERVIGAEQDRASWSYEEIADETIAELAHSSEDIQNINNSTICKECQKKAIIEMMRYAEENDMYDL